MKQGIVFLLLGLAASGAVLTVSAKAQQTKPTRPDEAALREAWRKTMKRTPLPQKGCFKASYPKTEWTASTCTVAPNFPLLPAHLVPLHRVGSPETVGNGYDFAAQATSGLLSSADGYFANASNVTSESGDINNVPPAYSNSFTLQLNSNVFNDPPACSGAAAPSDCYGWQQFVFIESNGGSASVFMQYWLLNYGNSCPGGWNGYGSDCYKNSSATGTPAYSASSLPYLQLEGQASGGTDTSIFASSEPADELYAVGNDSVLDLESYWTTAEYNVFGDAGGGIADLNSNATLIVQTSVNNGTTNAPLCVGPQNGGTTGETNNLSLIPTSAPVCCPLSGGSIQFMESNASGVSATCGSSGLEVGGNYTATPYAINVSEKVGTPHEVMVGKIIEIEIPITYTATLEDSTSGATIIYQMLNSCGEPQGGPVSVSSGTTITYSIEEISGESCQALEEKMYATASGYLPSLSAGLW